MTITQHAHIYSFRTSNFNVGEIFFLNFLSIKPLIMFTAAVAISMNRCYNIEFLDYCLCMSDKKDKVLQMNLILSSLDMVAQARLLAIMYLSVIVPLRCLVGNTHLLAGFGWGTRSMGRAMDILWEKVIHIKESPQLIVDESFLMNMFSTLLYLTPFKE